MLFIEGLFRVPIADYNKNKKYENFLINFLSQSFAGNGRQQMIEVLRKRKFLSDADLFELENPKSNGTEDRFETNHSRELKAMPIIETRILYHGKPVDVIYGLMTIRDNGLFDFIGTDSLKCEDNDPSFHDAINAVEKDLGLNQLGIFPKKESNVLHFDNRSSHVFCFTLSDNELHQIESNFTLNYKHNKTSFGIFRIPFCVSKESLREAVISSASSMVS